MAALISPTDDVTVVDGPLAGALAHVLSVDEAQRTAQLRLWIRRPDGSWCRAVAVLHLEQLELDAVDAPRCEPAVKAPRGRPRVIGDDVVCAVREMYATGTYSHAAIAQTFGISKSSVTLILRRASAGD